MRPRWVSIAVLAGALSTSACDECAGTPSCHNPPQISATGQIIDRASGAPLAGVSVTFMRDSGAQLVADTVRAVSDASGYFVLRAGALESGVVYGHMRVAAPAPFAPYTVPQLSFTTSTARGAGEFLGRIVAKPYFVLLGNVRDRETDEILPGTSVKVRRDSGGKLSADTVTFTTDAGGQFFWHPDVVEVAPLHMTFELVRAGDVRTYRMSRTLQMLFRDSEMSFQVLPVGTGLPYWGYTGRRGFARPVAGTQVRFRRTGGIQVQPSEVVIAIGDGNFDIPFKPLEQGTLNLEMTIEPPAPFPHEVHNLALETSDDAFRQPLGFFGYGAHVFFRAELRDAATNVLLPSGTLATLKRVSGLNIEWATPQDGDLRVTDVNGRLQYGAPTADSGQVTFDIIVRLPAPFLWDTIRGVTVQARYNDTAVNAGVVPVRRRTVP